MTKPEPVVSLDVLAAQVAMRHGIRVAELRGEVINRQLQKARVEFYELAKSKDFTLKAIGEFMSRDHATIHQVMKNHRTRNKERSQSGFYPKPK